MEVLFFSGNHCHWTYCLMFECATIAKSHCLPVLLIFAHWSNQSMHKRSCTNHCMILSYFWWYIGRGSVGWVLMNISSSNIFPICCCLKKITKIVRLLLAMASINALSLMLLVANLAITKQGSTLRVNLWPQASKNSQKQLRASKKGPQLVLRGQ